MANAGLLSAAGGFKIASIGFGFKSRSAKKRARRYQRYAKTIQANLSARQALRTARRADAQVGNYIAAGSTTGGYQSSNRMQINNARSQVISNVDKNQMAAQYLAAAGKQLDKAGDYDFLSGALSSIGSDLRSFGMGGK